MTPGGESIRETRVVDKTRINERIRVKEVRLIDHEGKQVGVVPTNEALKLAIEHELDLVEVAPSAVPPVCKIMDYGKYKYQMGKKAPVKRTDVKEVKIRPHIGEHDLERKVNGARDFLGEGHKVKVTMFFRGREKIRPEMGMVVFDKIKELLAGNYVIQQAPRHEGNSITMMLAPKGGK